MRTLMVTIQKGGQGKTMLAVHVASYAARNGLKVLFLDLDMQGNSSWTLQRHSSGVLASDFVHNRFEKIPEVKDGISLVVGDAAMADADDWDKETVRDSYREALRRCDPHFDLCVIDTPPTLGFAQSTTGLLASFVVAPVTMDWYSIQGLIKLQNIIANLMKQNRALKMIGIVPNCIDARKPRIMQALKDVQKAFAPNLVPYSIPMRDSIAEALADPEIVHVWASKRSAATGAKKILAQVCAYILTAMDIDKGD